MTNSCCAPNCREGYKPKKKKHNENSEGTETSEVSTKKFTLFSFPKHDTEPEKRAQWIARVPLKNWHPTTSAKIYICERHFHPHHIVSERSDTNKRRKRKKNETLIHKRLTPDAIPSLWPDTPSYLSKTSYDRQTTLGSSESRQEKVQKIREENEQKRIEDDTFRTLEEFIHKDKVIDLEGSLRLVTNQYILFYHIDLEEKIPKIKYSLKMNADLSIVASFNNELVTNIGCSVNTFTSFNKILQDLHHLQKSPATDEEKLHQIIEILRLPLFNGKEVKIGFIIEQLNLLLKKPTARRYSASLLALTALIQSVSPSCYKQMYNDGFLTLPSPDHLKRLTSAIDVDTMTLSESCKAYITARFNKIPERERIVTLMLDEVYSQQSVQYVNGKFFGEENEQITKTMLCMMIKSVAGKYRDIVAMVPISKINADKLFILWTDVMKKVTEIGFDVVVTMTDGHSSNMRLFNNKILKSADDLSVLNPSDPTSYNYPFYDNTHLFKNIYNNWNNYDLFCCPRFEPNESKESLSPSFSILKELYQLERVQHQKMAFKLNEKVLNPKPIEKTNVSLADAVFHESTLNALIYYSKNGYSHFEDTAIFIKYIRDWFNSINVKSIDYGKRMLDERRNPIRRESVNEDLSYLKRFVDWVVRWKNFPGMKGLSKQTFECLIRSCNALIALVPYLFDRYPFLQYILPGNISSDFLERRFGWYRQLCGGNYYNAVAQFLQAEKTIRLRSLVQIGYDMDEIKQIFKDSREKKNSLQKEEIKSFTNNLSDFRFTDDSVLSDSEKSIIYYLAGYIAKSEIGKCNDCNQLLSPGKVPLVVSIESVSDAETEISLSNAREDFITTVSRGGLTKPSNYLYIACANSSILFKYIHNDKDLFTSLLSTANPRDTFIESFLSIMETDLVSSGLLGINCIQGHAHKKHLRRCAFTMFNISAKNYEKLQNDNIRTAQREKRIEKLSKDARKIKKLQSR